MIKLFQLLTLLLALALPRLADAQLEVKIGVLAHRADSLQLWEPTARYLSDSVPGYQFKIVPHDNQSLKAAVGKGELEFIITNAGSYIGLEAEHGVTRILTLKALYLGRPLITLGAVIFTRADRNDIRTVRDLRNKSFMAVDREAFGGFLMGWLTFKENGINPFEDFSTLKFSGFPQEQIVHAVANGEVDAGTVRTGLLEQMSRRGRINMRQFRVLNPQRYSGFPFEVSTRLYPEWPFSKARHTSRDLSQQVASALLALPENSPAALASESAGWTVPLDYTPVHELYKALQAGPYQDYGKIEHIDVLRLYWHWLLAIFAAILVLSVGSIYILRLNQSLRQSEQRLRDTGRALERSNRRLERLSNTDALTGLANRRYFQEHLLREWKRAQREHKSVALLMIDIDFFKNLNDAYGHNAGDKALKSVAAKLSDAARRPGDLVARYGGEEFTVVLPNAAITTAAKLAESIRRSVAALAIPNEKSPKGGNLTISIGVAALKPKPNSKPLTLVVAADEALYQAKRKGRNRVVKSARK